MFMVCESPLHAGSGSDLDFIDNPIQRERHTGFPKIESSSLKGALRERFSEELGRENWELGIAFGPVSDNSNPEKAHQSSLGFTDARLLLFPVKSVKGVFAWVSCFSVLEKFKNEMNKAGNSEFAINPVLPLSSGEALVFSDKLVVDNGAQKSLILEEYSFEAKDDADVKVGEDMFSVWLANHLFPTGQFEYWNNELKNKLVILSDNDFADFVELTTEVITRNKIDSATGTVAQGHLFTEEYLPADSVLYSLVMAHSEFGKKKENETRKSAEENLDFFTKKMTTNFNNSFQAGGNATIGKGLIRSILI